MELNERNILEHAGKISHEMALNIAEKEYEKYCEIQKKEINQLESDFDKVVKQLQIKKTRHASSPLTIKQLKIKNEK